MSVIPGGAERVTREEMNISDENPFAAMPDQPISQSKSRSSQNSCGRSRASRNEPLNSSRSNSSSSAASGASVSSSGTGFNDSQQRTVKGWYGCVCWLCENPYSQEIVDVAHVFTKAGSEFQVTYQRGILAFLSPDHTDNAIPLCKLCHSNFDRVHPLCILLPVDLGWFLDFERADFEIRQRLLREGNPRPRVVPTADMHRAHLASKGLLSKAVNSDSSGGVYDVYLRGDFLSSPWERANGAPERLGYLKTKVWHGSPTAMILHAARVLGCVNPGVSSWLPLSLRQILYELVTLWTRELVLDQVPTSDGKGKNKIVAGGAGDVGSHEGQEVSRQSDGSGGGDHFGKHHSAASNITNADGISLAATLVDPVSRSTRGIGHQNKGTRWRWGPKTTSGQIVELFCQAQGSHVC
ncbi:hypothetical protein AA313_de0207989 [Arthrobotrys entomopaga]|nr:hypothetical protein AA313_de0207989 [Arthrobotrys entomopaga]